MPNITLEENTGFATHLKGSGGAAHVAMQGAGGNTAATSVTRLLLAADENAVVPAAAGLRLVGFACRESAAAAAVATINIVHGATVAGSVIVPIELAANASVQNWFGPDGVNAANGLSLDIVAGTVDIVLFYKTVV